MPRQDERAWAPIEVGWDADIRAWEGPAARPAPLPRHPERPAWRPQRARPVAERAAGRTGTIGPRRKKDRPVAAKPRENTIRPQDIADA